MYKLVARFNAILLVLAIFIIID